MTRACGRPNPWTHSIATLSCARLRHRLAYPPPSRRSSNPRWHSAARRPRSPPIRPLRSREDVLRYLARATDYERQSRTASRRTVFDLDRMRRLCAALGDPQLDPHTIHITGTKGKGSTALILHDLLRAHGHHAGLYTSPHLGRIEERIVVDGRPIPSRALAAALEEVRVAADRCRRRETRFAPTFFDLFTAAAFVHFRRCRVPFAVIEVGLGGRLDSTNVLSPSACAITTIDFDHTDILGPTLGQIAAEKCGILQPCVPCITAETKREPMAVIEAAVAAHGALLRRVGRDLRVTNVRPISISGAAQTEVCATVGQTSVRPARRGTAFNLTTPDHAWSNLRLPVAGGHQARNAAVAIGLLETLAAQGRLSLSRGAVRRALGGIALPGRVEAIRRNPWVVCDAAHNPAGIRALVEALKDLRPGRERGPTTFLFGCAADKDWRAMIRCLRFRGARLIVTRIPSPRSVPPRRLRSAALRAGWAGASVQIMEDPVPRLPALLADLPARGLLCVTGSFYLAGLLRPALLGLRGCG